MVDQRFPAFVGIRCWAFETLIFSKTSPKWRVPIQMLIICFHPKHLVNAGVDNDAGDGEDEDVDEDAGGNSLKKADWCWCWCCGW